MRVAFALCVLWEGSNVTNRAGRRLGKALDKVPVKDVMTWPITFLNVDKARAMWKEGPTSEFHMTGCVACSGCRHTRRQCVTCCA